MFICIFCDLARKERTIILGFHKTEINKLINLLRSNNLFSLNFQLITSHVLVTFTFTSLLLYIYVGGINGGLVA